MSYHPGCVGIGLMSRVHQNQQIIQILYSRNRILWSLMPARRYLPRALSCGQSAEYWQLWYTYALYFWSGGMTWARSRDWVYVQATGFFVTYFYNLELKSGSKTALYWHTGILNVVNTGPCHCLFQICTRTKMSFYSSVGALINC